jgi:Apea-like HEPN
MPTFHTVAPVYNLDLPVASEFDLAGGLKLTSVPSWLPKDSSLQSMSEADREAVETAHHAFVLTYEATALGDPDPDWTGAEAKSIQQSKYELLVLGNLALWLSLSSPVCFTIVVHAPQFSTEPVVQQISRHSPLLCHPQDVDARLGPDNVARAQTLHANLASTSRSGAVWNAIWATWAGLQMNIEPIRFSLFWIALEALFGPEDAREMTYRLSQRLAFFLDSDRAKAKELFATARKGYGFRSKIVHGRCREDADSATRMAEAENFVRRSFLQLFQDAELTKKFSEGSRDVS